jgi:hypothetical protein
VGELPDERRLWNVAVEWGDVFPQLLGGGRTAHSEEVSQQDVEFMCRGSMAAFPATFTFIFIL